MLKRNFFVEACWDEEARVFFSRSDITGLHIETATLEEFQAVMDDVTLELIIANHISPETLATKAPKDWMPFGRWTGPEHLASA